MQRKQRAHFNNAVLEMISVTRFNAFDGPDIALALRVNRRLWDAVWFDMAGAEDPFLKVQDPVRANTIYLRATKGLRNYEELETLIKSLHPSNVAHRSVDGIDTLAAWWD